MSTWLYRWYRFSTGTEGAAYPVYMSFLYWDVALFLITEFMRERGTFFPIPIFLPSLINFGGAISITFAE
ncbi:hypothetical protein V6B05_03200 [Lactococcus garvieae]|uniref:hypothetical protein n=1 Tax=Lactococcus garvieae TaxID=1363 RepID=UPI001F6230A3|nr:hypothetical protein [Lactococcus garvieae]MCI3859572.1 hypothetical protein [Lactococcus garvieae]